MCCSINVVTEAGCASVRRQQDCFVTHSSSLAEVPVMHCMHVTAFSKTTHVVDWYKAIEVQALSHAKAVCMLYGF